MRTRKPLDRNDIKIKKNWNVLEVGSGNNPNIRSNVLLEKYIYDNTHRHGDLRIYAHQEIVEGSAEKMPFSDKQFDYCICNQVLEHTENPQSFMKELCRVCKRGYIETPSLLGEFLFPKESHKWIVLDIDNKLVFYEKSKMPGNYKNDYGELFLNYLPYQSLIYKLLWFAEGDMMLNRYEWKDKIDYIVNPEDEYYKSFFVKAWDRAMVEKLYPKRGLGKEVTKSIIALFYICQEKIKVGLNKKKLLTIQEYNSQKNDRIRQR